MFYIFFSIVVSNSFTYCSKFSSFASNISIEATRNSPKFFNFYTTSGVKFYLMIFPISLLNKVIISLKLFSWTSFSSIFFFSFAKISSNFLEREAV
jgi:hypothetical protein